MKTNTKETVVTTPVCGGMQFTFAAAIDPGFIKEFLDEIETGTTREKLNRIERASRRRAKNGKQ